LRNELVDLAESRIADSGDKGLADQGGDTQQPTADHMLDRLKWDGRLEPWASPAALALLAVAMMSCAVFEPANVWLGL